MLCIHSYNQKNEIIFHIILIRTFFLSKVKEERRQEKKSSKTAAFTVSDNIRYVFLMDAVLHFALQKAICMFSQASKTG